MIFQQDQGPPPYTRAVWYLWDAEWPNSWIDRARPAIWPAHSPDLTHVTFSKPDIVKTNTTKPAVIIYLS